MVTRRQAAIFVADVVGYSRMMAEDEIGTHERIKSVFDDLVPPAIKQFNGRMVKTMGDGVMLDFGEAVDAVECAADFQTAVQRLPTTRSNEWEMAFRIGINYGDIIVEENDIYGTPVNVASRLEGLAEPGGVAVSGATYWNVKDKTEIQFEEMGFLNLKNIPYPIEVYRVVTEGAEEGDTSIRVDAEPLATTRKVWSDGHEHLPSIVILPFENLSRDSEQDYFCDGLTQDLTTDLSRFANLAMISSNSAFSYKGKHVPVDQLHTDLGAEYAVTGAVQRAGEAVRINVQLHETKTGRQVWAERFQGTVENLFVLQDEMVGKIVASLASRLTIVERERVAQKETENVNAYEAFLKGLHFMSDFLGANEDRGTLDNCQHWLERAIDLDRDYARPWGWLAYVHVQSWLHGWSEDEALETAEEFARRAVALDPADHDTHWALGSVLFNSGKLDLARPAYEKALELNVNDADLHAEMADMLSYTGEHLEAISRIKFAMHLNPHFPEWYRWNLGWCFYFMRDYEEAISELGKILNPSNEALLIVAASHAKLAEQHRQAGDDTKARDCDKNAEAHVKKLLKRRPDWTVERQRNVTRLRDEEDLKHLLDGIELAGLPR